MLQASMDLVVPIEELERADFYGIHEAPIVADWIDIALDVDRGLVADVYEKETLAAPDLRRMAGELVAAAEWMEAHA